MADVPIYDVSNSLWEKSAWGGGRRGRLAQQGR